MKGKPPVWTPPVSPTRLKEDDGRYFRDPNAARYPNHPVEPAVRAIFASRPSFKAKSIDLFACANTLGNLLRFVRGVDKPFRILVETIGDTVFFVRRENSPTELIPDVRGYGHSFPETYTTWGADVKTSESHQRILGYQFAGLSCLIRFEADGYLKDIAKEENQVAQVATSSEADDLASEFADLSSNMSSTQSHFQNNVPLTMIHGGQQVPRAAIFDLKTRSIRKKEDQDTLREQLPRLWVSQIPNFILAYHDSGVFDEIQVCNVAQEIESWERENQGTLRRFAFLLRKIVSFVTSMEHKKLELHRRELGVLEIREQTKDVAQSMSPDIEARWIVDSNELNSLVDR
ncbi:MAG: hypothetical protein Q9167_000503 [Letrouitia subvulpina]